MDYSLTIIVLLFTIAVLAGCIDALAGGGGLITIPTLLLCGVPPVAAIATNKLGGVGGSLAATVHFIRLGELDLRKVKLTIVTSFIGAILGGVLLTWLDSGFLATVVPVLLIGFALYFLFSPNLGELDAKPWISSFAYALTLAPLIGFYDGFFGPGTGAFLAISLVLLRGFNLVKATAYAKLLNFCSNLAALSYFIIDGSLIWPIGIAMFIGQVIGGSLGARWVLRSGRRLIKIAMVLVTTAISSKLMFFS